MLRVKNIKIKIKVIVSRLNLQQLFFINCKIQQSNITNIVYYYFYIFIFVFFLAILIIYICICIYVYVILSTLYLYLILQFKLLRLCLCCVKTKLFPFALTLRLFQLKAREPMLFHCKKQKTRGKGYKTKTKLCPPVSVA